MIPKIIHYCWLSDDPIPIDLQRYMDTWKVLLADYEFIKWDFDRFPKHQSLWVKEAFDSKKYAFAADYIRLYALYNYGGIYLDMDVEVKQNFDDFLSLNTMVCFENSNDNRLEMAVVGAAKHEKWIGECLAFYDNRHFISENGKMETEVLPCIIRNILLGHGYTFQLIDSVKEIIETEKSIPVFPFDYFSPKSYSNGKTYSSSRTVCIHQFSGTWLPWYAQLEKRIFNRLGLKNHDILRKIVALLWK